jgi:RNA polymerase sigma factor (sigma-70 family)
MLIRHNVPCAEREKAPLTPRTGYLALTVNSLIANLEASTESRPYVSYSALINPNRSTKDADAYRERLFREFRPLVQRLIRQYGSDPELRQDLEGEIYCQFCHLLEDYDPSLGVPLRPYLVRKLSASIYSYARGQWRRSKREASLELYVPTLAGTDPTQDWDHRLLTEQLGKQLPAAIGRLPPRQQQVVLWRYYEHHSFEEIAAKLNVRPATARSLLRYGLINLRRWCASEDHDCL